MVMKYGLAGLFHGYAILSGLFTGNELWHSIRR